jgi:chemotaxis protein MotB
MSFGLEWESTDRDEIWFISYADLISVILAMVVLLFGRIALTNASSADEIAFVGPPVDAIVPAPAAAESVETPPDNPENDVPSPEVRLAALVEERFAGKIDAELRGHGVVLTIADVALFDSARARLQDSARPLLAEFAASLREAGDARISVGGHTDNVPVAGGEFDSNWDLAAARANAVTQYLLEQGFDPLRLQSVSYADTRPVADNATPLGRAANRRVEIQLEFVGGEAG